MLSPRFTLLLALALSSLMPLRAADTGSSKTKSSRGAEPASPGPAKAKSAKAVSYPLVLGPFRLYEGDAPGAQGTRPQDIPTLTPFPADPKKRTGATMLIFPGGGYGNLAEHEGTGTVIDALIGVVENLDATGPEFIDLAERDPRGLGERHAQLPEVSRMRVAQPEFRGGSVRAGHDARVELPREARDVLALMCPALVARR